MPQIDLGAILSYAIAGLFVAFYLYVMWLAAREWAFTYWLSQYGKVTQAQIVERSTIGSSKGGSTQSVQFRFTLVSEYGEAEFTNQQQISRRHFNRLKYESYVHVIYIPRNPNLVRLY